MSETLDSEEINSAPINDDDLINSILNEENEEETNKDEPAVDINESQQENKESASEKSAGEKSLKFPLSRIKAIMKMDPELGIPSQEAVVLITKATEMFLARLAKDTYTFTAKAKRKTVQKRDVDAAIENTDALCFLEGALD